MTYDFENVSVVHNIESFAGCEVQAMNRQANQRPLSAGWRPRASNVVRNLAVRKMAGQEVELARVHPFVAEEGLVSETQIRNAGDDQAERMREVLDMHDLSIHDGAIPAWLKWTLTDIDASIKVPAHIGAVCSDPMGNPVIVVVDTERSWRHRWLRMALAVMAWRQRNPDVGPAAAAAIRSTSTGGSFCMRSADIELLLLTSAATGKLVRRAERFLDRVTRVVAEQAPADFRPGARCYKCDERPTCEFGPLN